MNLFAHKVCCNNAVTSYLESDHSSRGIYSCVVNGIVLSNRCCVIFYAVLHCTLIKVRLKVDFVLTSRHFPIDNFRFIELSLLIFLNFSTKIILLLFLKLPIFCVFC